MAKTAIPATGLNKWFGEGEARTRAVKDVSFEANFGEMLYIVGPSGSGKTTMLSIISGILRPDSGSVRVEDTDIWAISKISSPSSACIKSVSSSRTTTCSRV